MLRELVYSDLMARGGTEAVVKRPKQLVMGL